MIARLQRFGIQSLRCSLIARRKSNRAPKIAGESRAANFSRGLKCSRLVEGFGILDLGARDREMRIDLATIPRPLTGQIVRDAPRASRRRGEVREAGRKPSRCEALASSLALSKTCGGAVSSGVLNRLEVDPAPAEEDSMAIGMASRRPRITGIIHSSNGNDTA